MTPDLLLVKAVEPGCALCSRQAGRELGTRQARVLLLAIALQETNLEHRLQLGGGPGRGFWQFEKGPRSGLAGLMRREPCKGWVRAICGELLVPPNLATVHEALAWHDVLAAALARLLLVADPQPLPAADDRDGGWATYLRVWNPGRPRPERWAECHAMALQADDP